MSKSVIDFQSCLKSTACLLCISPLEGSSRRIRFTMIFSSFSVNHPLGRYHDFVWVGEAAIMNQDHTPTQRVNIPSIRNSHRHPSYPFTPRRRRSPKARIGAMTSTMRNVVQNSARRNGNSVPLKKYDYQQGQCLHFIV